MMTIVVKEIAFGVLSFLLGIVLTCFVSAQASDTFSEIDRIHEQMQQRMNEVFNKNFFNSTLQPTEAHSQLGISLNEDDNFKYVEIDISGIDESSLEINISQGMISLSAQTKTEHDDQGSRSQSFSSFTSRFTKSVSIPREVDESSAKISKKDDKIIVKFSKRMI